MKKTVIAALLVAGLATTGLVWAHGNGGYGMGYGYGMGGYHMMGDGYGMMGGHGSRAYGMMGPGMMGGYGQYNCPGAAGFDRDDADYTQQQKFMDDTAGLRKQINDKQFDYMEARRNPSTTREQLAEMEKDIYSLQSQLRDRAE
jgi:hypothetical protein